MPFELMSLARLNGASAEAAARATERCVVRNRKRAVALLTAFLALAAPFAVHAQTTVYEDFSGTTTQNSWYFGGGACLTASTLGGKQPTGTNDGQLPGCTTIVTSYYGNTNGDPSLCANGGETLVGGQNGVAGTTQTLPDPVGHGALRFTNGYPFGYCQYGAVISQTPFPSNAGVALSFKSVTYRGNGPNNVGKPGSDGADGMSFFLMDGSQPPSVGANGGALAYSCTNEPPPQSKQDGIVGGYLEVGIDEFGNGLNGNGLMPGYTGTNPWGNVMYVSGPLSDHGYTGYGYHPNRIGLMGGGNVAWSWLNANYPAYYPSSFTASQQQIAVQMTCAYGVVWDSATNSPALSGGKSIPVADYAPIPNAYVELPSSVQIAAENAMARPGATPFIYQLRITSDGYLSFSYSVNGGAYQKVITNQLITNSNVPMPPTFRFGFAASTGGDSNIHEILCFKAAPETGAASSAGVSERQSGKLETGVQAYFAFYNPSEWTGRVTASGLGYDSYGNVVVAAAPNWDASCALTGVPSGLSCITTGVAGPTAALAPASRVMLSWNGNAGIPFEWGNLTATQQAALDAGDALPINANRLQFLRGDRTNEINSYGVGLFRARISVLADIVDSSPTWVGPPIAPYPASWKDRLYPSATMAENGVSAQTYPQYVLAAETRLNVVYVGANDGFVHGFRTGSFDINNNFLPTYNDGQEVLAYMPGAVAQTIHSTTSAIDYPNNQYAHAFSVDATPGAGDVFYGNAWHTVLAGGLGPGGSAIYLLDVTNPASTNFTEANAASLVLGEWTPSTISCTNVASCGNNMGQTYGTPQLRRLHNGNWAVIFGNGLGSTSGDAGIFIMTINASSAAKTFYYLSTSTGSSASPNGIAFVSPTDLDGDHITDYVYAGDIQGNLWRFDLTSKLESNWTLTPGPVFKTPSGQPITTEIIAAAAAPNTGMTQQLMLLFGTGRKFPLTTTNPATYATATQSLYGVWDWNLTAWNSLSVAQYAAMTSSSTGLSTTNNYMQQSNLQRQIVTVNANTQNRDIASNATVCWASQSICSSTKQFGWYLNLPGTQEQVIFSPQLAGSAFTVNTMVPAQNDPTSCVSTTDTGFTYVVNALSGGAYYQVFLPPDQAINSAVNTNPRYTDTTAIAMQTNAVGSSYIIDNSAGTKYLIYETDQTQGGSGAGSADIGSGALGLNVPANNAGRRLSWVERR